MRDDDILAELNRRDALRRVSVQRKIDDAFSGVKPYEERDLARTGRAWRRRFRDFAETLLRKLK